MAPIDASPRALYSIGAVARMLEVPPGTLRSWEDRYALVVPERGQGGQRLYSRDQLEQLRFVVAQMTSGVSAADAHRVLAERMGADGPDWLTVPQEDARVVVLLAERDAYAAEFSDYFLRTEGYEVLTTLDAQKAEERYGDRAPQVVVLDMQISGGAGPALCQAFKEREGVSVLAISTLESRDEALASGADAFLQKPLDPLQLISAVQDLLVRSAFLRRRPK
jgi:DNA-binding transcriptional MerR regulator